jgi:hypothetical protein
MDTVKTVTYSWKRDDAKAYRRLGPDDLGLKPDFLVQKRERLGLNELDEDPGAQLDAIAKEKQLSARAHGVSRTYADCLQDAYAENPDLKVRHAISPNAYIRRA